MSQSKKTKIEFGPMLEGDMSFEMSYDPEGIEEFQEKINEALGGDQGIRISSDFHSMVGRGYFYPSKCQPVGVKGEREEIWLAIKIDPVDSPLPEIHEEKFDEWAVEYTVKWTEGPFWEWWILGDLFNPELHLIGDRVVKGTWGFRFYRWWSEVSWWSHLALNYLVWSIEVWPAGTDIHNNDEAPSYRYSEGQSLSYINLPPEGSGRGGNFTTLPKEDWLE